MKERKNNVNTLLWLMVTLSVMIVFLTLSSCNSSVNSNGKGGKTPSPTPITVKITVIAPKEGGSIKVNGEVLKETKEFTPKVGDTMAFEAVHSDGYKFKEWIPKKLGNKETFELTVDKDLSVSIEFEKDLSTMTILEFLDYKIGFDRNKKEKSDVIYTTSGLGFGKKANDPSIYYHGYNKRQRKIIPMNISEEQDNFDDFKKSGITKQFESIYEGLNARWRALCNTELKSGFFFNSDETPDNIARYFYPMLSINYLVSIDSKKEALYTKINSLAHDSYYLDLHIAFVKEGEPDKGYSIHFCHINDRKEYEPYLLLKSGNLKYTTYPPDAEPEYNEENQGNVHMFKLSSLLKTSLKNLRKKNSETWKYSEEQLANALLEEVRKKQYDIYIIFGCRRSIPEKDDSYSNSSATSAGGHWRNVLKFGDPFWSKTKKP